MKLVLDTLQKKIKYLKSDQLMAALPGIRRGFEKECLRMHHSDQLAMAPHPRALGSNLTHPLITTDYSESLLEFVTAPHLKISDLLDELVSLHQYTYSVLKDEFLWALSMPGHLPENENDIPIARYGFSNLGLLKYYYRVGLGHRYGKRMQMIAGVHYNFSFSEKFWAIWQNLLTGKSAHQADPNFISEQYLGMIRNGLRLGGWLSLLFGASPAFNSDFIPQSCDEFKLFNKDTLLLPYATSLRLSDIGYHNKAKPLIEVAYDSFPSFMKTLGLSVHSPDPAFAKIGVKVDGEYRQLSDCILQVEDEHYALLRPKRLTGPGERMFPALLEKGIEYIEVRALDLDPFSPIGVGPETVYLLDMFLILCFLMDSPPFTQEEQSMMARNYQKILKEGRKPGLKCETLESGERLLQDLSYDILAAMEPIAECLDRAYGENNFSKALLKARHWIADFNQLPSARMLSEMQRYQESFCEFANRWSKRHAQTLKAEPLTQSLQEYYAELAERSWVEQRALERRQQGSFDDYLKNFLEA